MWTLAWLRTLRNWTEQAHLQASLSLASPWQRLSLSLSIFSLINLKNGAAFWLRFGSEDELSLLPLKFLSEVLWYQWVGFQHHPVLSLLLNSGMFAVSWPAALHGLALSKPFCSLLPFTPHFLGAFSSDSFSPALKACLLTCLLTSFQSYILVFLSCTV